MSDRRCGAGRRATAAAAGEQGARAGPRWDSLPDQALAIILAEAARDRRGGYPHSFLGSVCRQWRAVYLTLALHEHADVPLLYRRALYVCRRANPGPSSHASAVDAVGAWLARRAPTLRRLSLGLPDVDNEKEEGNPWGEESDDDDDAQRFRAGWMRQLSGKVTAAVARHALAAPSHITTLQARCVCVSDLQHLPGLLRRLPLLADATLRFVAHDAAASRALLRAFRGQAGRELWEALSGGSHRELELELDAAFAFGERIGEAMPRLLRCCRAPLESLVLAGPWLLRPERPTCAGTLTELRLSRCVVKPAAAGRPGLLAHFPALRRLFFSDVEVAGVATANVPAALCRDLGALSMLEEFQVADEHWGPTRAKWAACPELWAARLPSLRRLIVQTGQILDVAAMPAGGEWSNLTALTLAGFSHFKLADEARWNMTLPRLTRLKVHGVRFHVPDDFGRLLHLEELFLDECDWQDDGPASWATLAAALPLGLRTLAVHGGSLRVEALEASAPALAALPALTRLELLRVLPRLPEPACCLAALEELTLELQDPSPFIEGAADPDEASVARLVAKLPSLRKFVVHVFKEEEWDDEDTTRALKRVLRAGLPRRDPAIDLVFVEHEPDEQ